MDHLLANVRADLSTIHRDRQSLYEQELRDFPTGSVERHQCSDDAWGERLLAEMCEDERVSLDEIAYGLARAGTRWQEFVVPMLRHLGVLGHVLHMEGAEEVFGNYIASIDRVKYQDEEVNEEDIHYG